MGEPTPEGHKSCRICEEVKPLANFLRRPDSPDGYRNECNACIAKRRKQYDAEHPEIKASRYRERTCADCGVNFMGRLNRCRSCRETERSCAKCAVTYKGLGTTCRPCQRKDRACTECGRAFRGTNTKCTSCYSYEHQCIDCGRTFNGATKRCNSCMATERDCAACGKRFTGTSSRCGPCWARDRECVNCGRKFKGTKNRCWPCDTTDRICAGCQLPFRGHQLFCTACVARDRNCEECGRRFRSTSRVCATCKWLALPLEERQEYARKIHAERRQRLAAAEVDGPVPWSVYQAVMKSGPCSYCGDEAKTVDHIRPLTRGGIEHESNLTPACKRCNGSKAARLLTEWHPERVLHAIDACPKVAAEYERQVNELIAA